MNLDASYDEDDDDNDDNDEKRYILCDILLLPNDKY